MHIYTVYVNTRMGGANRGVVYRNVYAGATQTRQFGKTMPFPRAGRWCEVCIERIPIDRIRIDGGTQPRAAIHQPTVQEYAEAMTEGFDFPPVVTFCDGAAYWLADGFHRVEATKSIGLLEIEAIVHMGTQDDATDYACSDVPNSKHGLRETKADRERRVMTMVRKHPDWSGARIAVHCGVPETTVRRYKNDLSSPMAKIDQPAAVTVTRGYSTYTMNTGNIGKREEVAATAPEKPAAASNQPAGRKTPVYHHEESPELRWVTEVCALAAQIAEVSPMHPVIRAFRTVLDAKCKAGDFPH